ncbi:LD-carboxypeptidase [Chryseobacterium phosphatilyticum]|uniref:LD-carboxypeptidase n=1 Tax=Chryseobacterium phosphatilyticum TaxID=475075 RepID=A0A316X6P2_9FLAO|nr:S66 peptidase family protein [Chryseobacterium phosphatilyticum]PWN69471.1 LD-carboxypeptidase [Chryseobacterium phosphatilyticum]
MKLITPKGLSAGDKVATISMSWGGAGDLPHRYLKGKQRLKEIFNLEVTETRHALKSAQWIYNNPEARANDLMEAFADPSVKAIISNIGGDDSIRILKYIDLNIIKNNPKIFLGFSDSTITHFICLKAGLSSFYGTSLLVGFAENAAMHDYQVSDIKRTLFSSSVVGPVYPHKEGWTTEFLDWFDVSLQDVKRKLTPPSEWQFIRGNSIVQGPLIGGCMEVLEMLKGTDYWPASEIWKDSILFFETSEDKPKPEYVRWWLRNYAAMGILENAKGIIFGRPYDNLFTEEYETEILKVLDEEGLYDLPVVTRMDFGHTCPTFTLPYGRLAEINCIDQTFSILESGVA